MARIIYAIIKHGEGYRPEGKWAAKAANDSTVSIPVKRAYVALTQLSSFSPVIVALSVIGRHATIDAVQLITAQVLGAGGLERATEKSGEMPHGAEVAALGLGGQFTHPHVFDHALTQRRDTLS